MDESTARARMLRLWMAMGDANGAPVTILTTQKYVPPLLFPLLCLAVAIRLTVVPRSAPW